MNLTGSFYKLRIFLEKALIPDKVLNSPAEFFVNPEDETNECFEHISLEKGSIERPAFLDLKKNIHIENDKDHGFVRITAPETGYGCADAIYAFGPEDPKLFLVEKNRFGLYPDKKFYFEIVKVIPHEESATVTCTKWQVEGANECDDELEVIARIMKGEGSGSTETHEYPM